MRHGFRLFQIPLTESIGLNTKSNDEEILGSSLAVTPKGGAAMHVLLYDGSHRKRSGGGGATDLPVRQSAAPLVGDVLRVPHSGGRRHDHGRYYDLFLFQMRYRVNCVR